MLRLVIAFLCAAAACMLVAGALTSSAQSPASSTPDSFVTQITRSVRFSATNPVNSFTGDTSANGRFVVIESNGDIATEKTATRNNQDGNREIFLFDYAQRRIFQITNTRSVMKPATSPSPSPSPSPSVSPSPSPSVSPTPPVDETTNVQIEISNNRPMISLEPTLSGSNRTYTIVFSSNAPVSPASFDGTDPGAPTNTDMNQEIWTYQFTVADNANLSSGAEVPLTDLSGGTFSRITNTAASRAPSPGGTLSNGLAFPPFIADDNRDAQISDNGQVIAFISTRNFTGTAGFTGAGNPDFNPEVYVFNRASSSLIQITNTTTTSANNPIFSSNPCVSSDGSTIAFVSNANLISTNDDGGGLSNAEIYLVSFNPATNAVGAFRQVTKTKNGLPAATPGVSPDPSTTANLFTFGRRLSRDGKFIAFETIASDPKANGSNTTFYTPFVYDVNADTFAQLGPRATSTQIDPVLHVPVFTDYNGALSPGSVLWTSALNYKSDGTLVTDTTGLNPLSVAQIFRAPLPVISSGPFTRLTNFGLVGGGLGAFPSASRSRIAFSRPAELGGGNNDGSTEAFYALAPTLTTESTSGISLFTGASFMVVPVTSPTPTPSPNVSPTASPSPSPSPSPSVSPAAAPSGFAAGELAVAKGTFGTVTSATVSNANASESKRSPFLPVELNGISVSIGSASCGLFAVSSTQITFVVPIGLTTGTYPITIGNANTGTVFRGAVVIVSAQPDIFTTTNGAGGRASVCNATVAGTCTAEPFFVTTKDGTGTQVPTVLRMTLTGVRNSSPSTLSVKIGSTVITPSINTTTDLPGTDNLFFTLPSTVDTGDQPITVVAGVASSRDATTAPHITINSGGSPLPNPLDGTAFFVRQQYLDFLNREPDADGYAFWQNQINACGGNAQCIEVARINTSAAFFLSIEFQQTGYLVYRTYEAAYGDLENGTAPVPLTRSEFLPDTRQIGTGVIVNQGDWRSTLENNKQAYFASFVTRDRFLQKYPASMTAQAFVDALYQNAGIAQGSGNNRAAALNEVASTPADNTARAHALRLVAEDPAMVQQEFNKAFVLMEYFGYLQRNPNDAPDGNWNGFNFWLTKLNQFNGDFIQAEMVKAFLSSAEYRQRFGS